MKVAREAWPFLAGELAVSLVLALAVRPAAGLVGLPLLACTAWFFRDPDRCCPGRPGELVSPVDGRVLRAGGGRVSIFMSVLDVHVCRAPLGGRVQTVEHTPGRFLAAFRDEASEMNERLAIRLATASGPLTLTMVAGLVARRIVCRVRPGQSIAAGDRVGLIRFGSRVDLALPAGAELTVGRGDRVRGGETVIVRLGRSYAPGAEARPLAAAAEAS
jgi:phosphatidylserine decarboxylase